MVTIVIGRLASPPNGMMAPITATIKLFTLFPLTGWSMLYKYTADLLCLEFLHPSNHTNPWNYYLSPLSQIHMPGWLHYLPILIGYSLNIFATACTQASGQDFGIALP